MKPGSGNQRKIYDGTKKFNSRNESLSNKKLVEDFGYDCNYCNGKNHLAKVLVLKKKEEKKEKVKHEAYYTMKIEELRVETKNISLMEKGEEEKEGTYQIWLSGSDEEEMCHPTHGALFAKHGLLSIDEAVSNGEAKSDR